MDSAPASATAKFAAVRVFPSRACAEVTRTLTTSSALGRPRLGCMLEPQSSGYGLHYPNHYFRSRTLVRWDMFRDGKYSWVWLDRHGNGEKIRNAAQADPYRKAPGVPKNGAVATITCDGTRCRRPQRDGIKQKLEYAVPLRTIMAAANRQVKLQYADEEVVNLRYFEPNG